MTTRFYAMVFVKGGTRRGVKIWRAHPVDPVTGEVLTERPCIWRCEIDGIEDAVDEYRFDYDSAEYFGTLKPLANEINAREIDELEYRRLCAIAERARTYFPDSAEADPRKKIDHLASELLF